MALLEVPSSRLTINAVTPSLRTGPAGGGRALSPRHKPGEPPALAPPPPTLRGEGKEPRSRVIYHRVDPGHPRGLPQGDAAAACPRRGREAAAPSSPRHRAERPALRGEAAAGRGAELRRAEAWGKSNRWEPRPLTGRQRPRRRG